MHVATTQQKPRVSRLGFSMIAFWHTSPFLIMVMFLISSFNGWFIELDGIPLLLRSIRILIPSDTSDLVLRYHTNLFFLAKGE
jgi:hypothetical protein